KELIETQKDEKEETAQLKRELSFTRRTINRIKEAIEAGEITLEKEKTEEYHFLEILAIYVRQAIVESEREINQLEATPRKGDPDYETSLKTHKELRKELAKFEDILKRLIDEIVYEAHLLSEDTALVSKMKRVNRQVYGKEYKQQMKQEIRAESRFKIE
ncbi:TPA: hypothetical protein H1005_00620, partial [archaeon]|nr:hypothetical protein [Candidatus Naiadarchaeales archaeon SRR2090153.bin1042]